MVLNALWYSYGYIHISKSLLASGQIILHREQEKTEVTGNICV